MAGQKKSPSEILQDGRAEKTDVIKAFGISVLLYLVSSPINSINKTKVSLIICILTQFYMRSEFNGLLILNLERT